MVARAKPVTLYAFDPLREIRPLRIDARVDAAAIAHIERFTSVAPGGTVARTIVAVAVIALAVSPRSSFADYASTVPSSLDGPFPNVCSHDEVGPGCRPYGTWNAAHEDPYVLVGVGFNLRRLPRNPSPSQIARSSEAGTVAPLGSNTSYTISQTLDIMTTSVSYIGLDIEVSPTASEPLAPGERSIEAGGAFLFGLHSGTSTLRFSVELAAGGRIVDGHDVTNGGETVLEVRAHGDLWISPWFTVGALVGASLLDRGDVVTGIQLGFHSWLYGGSY